MSKVLCKDLLLTEYCRLQTTFFPLQFIAQECEACFYAKAHLAFPWFVYVAGQIKP